jgi:long-chain fatty acid transport protein
MVAASLAIAIVVPRVSEAQCGAFCVYEVGSPDNFMSAAGASARAQDAATALFNVAGTTRLEGIHVMVSTAVGFIDQEFNVSKFTLTDIRTSIPDSSPEGNSGGALGDLAALGAAFVSAQISDTPLRAAFSLSGLYGGNLDYDNDWAGRTLITETSLVGLNLAPGAAYGFPLGDDSSGRRFSIGGALNALFLKLNFQRKAQFTETTTFASPTVEVNDAKDWAFAGTLALLYEHSLATRVGLNYRTPASVNLSGDFDSPLPTAEFDSKFDLAQGLNLGAFHAFTPKLAVLADVGWSDWSTFDYQSVRLASNNQPPIPRSFHDTWRIGAGVQYSPGAKSFNDPGYWRLNGGFSYDSSPVDADDRLPDLPASEQFRFSLGGDLFAAENIRLGLGYTLFWAANNEIDGAQFPGDVNARGEPVNFVTLSGDYDPSFVHFVGFNIAVNFGGKSKT